MKDSELLARLWLAFILLCLFIVVIEIWVWPSGYHLLDHSKLCGPDTNLCI